MHSISTLFPLAFYKIFMIYFWKIHVFFSQKANFARFEKLHYFIRILRETWNVQQIYEQSTFLSKNLLFLKKTQTLKVLRSFITSVEFYRLIATFTGFKKIKFFLQNSIFFSKKQMMNDLRNLTISNAFYDNVAIISDFEELMFSFGKTHLVFLKNQFLNVLRFFTLSVAFSDKYAIISKNLKFWKFFFRKPIFLEITPKPERFEKSYKFSRFLRKVCYI